MLQAVTKKKRRNTWPHAPPAPPHPYRSNAGHLYNLWWLQRQQVLDALRTGRLRVVSPWSRREESADRCSIHLVMGWQTVVAYHFVQAEPPFWLLLGGQESKIYHAFNVRTGQRLGRTLALSRADVAAITACFHQPPQPLANPRLLTCVSQNPGHHLWNELSGLFTTQPDCPASTEVWLGPNDMLECARSLARFPCVPFERTHYDCCWQGVVIMLADLYLPAAVRTHVQRTLGVAATPPPTNAPRSIWVELRPPSGLRACRNQVAAVRQLIAACPPTTTFVLAGLLRWPGRDGAPFHAQALGWEAEVEAEAAAVMQGWTPQRFQVVNGVRAQEFVQQCARCQICFVPAGSNTTVSHMLLNKPSVVHTNGLRIDANLTNDRWFIEGYNPEQILAVVAGTPDDKDQRHSAYTLALNDKNWSRLILTYLANTSLTK